LSNPTPASFEAFTFQHVPNNFKPVFVQLVDAWNANPSSISIKDNTITIAKELANIRVNVPTVGASGAVFGLLLAFGMLFPNTLIYIYFFFPLKAKYFVALYGAFELYSGIQNNPSDNVAHFAHLGGMLFGYILIKYWQKNQFRQY
jgi:membrane associated rhomboid family serine protease